MDFKLLRKRLKHNTIGVIIVYSIFALFMNISLTEIPAAIIFWTMLDYLFDYLLYK